MTRTTLQIILKIAERCNLNCSYCYYFNMDDATPGARPALIGQDTVEALAGFLKACAATGAYERALVVLHGGEPMLMPAQRARQALQTLQQVDLDGMPLHFGVQTNATLAGEDWLDLIAEFNVSVCVSLDGDQATHDLYRRDKKDRPTHAQVDAAVHRLNAFCTAKGLAPVTLMAVAGASASGRETYAYFTRELGARFIDFLLPDATHDIFDPETGRRAETFLETAFARWIEDEDRPHIPYFRDYVDTFMAGGAAPDPAAAPGPAQQPNIFTVYSDGRVTGNDYVRSLLVVDETARLPALTAPAQEIFDHVAELEGFAHRDTPPGGCASCRWVKACRGGQMLHRHSRETGFDNPSVYCGHIKRMYAQLQAAFDAETVNA